MNCVLARVLSGLFSAGSGVIVFLVVVAVIVLSRGRWTAPRSDATVREVA